MNFKKAFHLFGKICIALLGGSIFITSCQNTKSISPSMQTSWPQNIQPPVAEKKPYNLTAFGDTRVDEYYWMNDYFKKGPDSSNVVKYLAVENQYYETMMAGTNNLQEKLYNEMKARIKEDDASVPSFKNGYYYYTRQVEGKDYYLYCRKKSTLSAPEEILLDVNAMAEGHEYYSIGGITVSPDNRLLAYSVDAVGRREYTMLVRDLITRRLFNDAIPGTEGSAEWAADNKTFFYVSKNPVTLLSEKVKRHVLGTAASEDVVVYEEKDPTNYIGVSKSKSDTYIFITSGATLSSEVKILSADDPMGTFVVFQPRMTEVLYDVDHAGDLFYIRTNKDAKNFKLMTAKEGHTTVGEWQELVPHNSKILVENFDVFKNFIAIGERMNGLAQIHILPKNNGQAHDLDFGEATYAAGLMSTPEYETDSLRFSYTSLTTPASVFDYNMATRQKVLKKQQEVVGGYSAGEYVTERLFATAADGTKIPISLVYKKGYKKDGNGPLLLYGYGSYGNSIDAGFSTVRLSLLNRGFAYAIAHIRGGQEMGRYWYEDGKMMKKKNTFTDFIQAGEFLISNNFITKNHLYAMGGSAGGMLMGAITNMRPDLWHGIVAQVPFVDVITTMSDPSIPLTTNEYDEWGNPANEASYRYMKSYSPYDNIKETAYPNM
ncbi:MAG: S9 family peptidase, partial [Ferruginibacter sp.]